MSAVELHCEARGTGTPLLLAGSLGTTLRMWGPVVDALGHDHHVVALDHRGHGGSPVPAGPYAIADLGADVLALMDRLEIQRAAFCGLSIGGMVGLWLAAHAPSRLSALVVICSAAHVPFGDAYRERARTVRAAGSVEPVADAVVARWVTPGFAAHRPEGVAALRHMLVATPAEGYASCCDAIAAMDLRDDITTISVPTLVIAGREDEALPLVHSEAIAAAIDDARLEILSPAAHLAAVECAGEVTALVLDHLREHVMP